MNLLAITWNFDPIFFSIGSLEIAYYGLMWVIGLLVSEKIFSGIVKREGLNEDLVISGFLYMAIAAILGARLGHCLFYEPARYLANPLEILNFRQGGLASHGAAIGMVFGMLLWSRKWKISPWWMFDRIGIMVAVAGAFVRLGNLCNSEIYGTATDLPWGFIFVRDGQTTAMHPTQIYEALMYLATFAVMLHLYYRTKLSDKRGVMFGSFLIMLFGSRLIIETIKQVQETWEVDMIAQWGLNMGQVLSLPFIIAGVVVLIIALRRPAQPYVNMPLPMPVKKVKKRK